MTLAEVDAVPEAQQLGQKMNFDAQGIHAMLDPDSIEMGVLQKADILVLRMIRDSWPQRPMYFSLTAGGPHPYPRQLGLGDYLLEQGLAWKIVMPPKKPSADTLYLTDDGGTWYDVQRSKDLWLQDFEAPKSLIRRGSWIDAPSEGIPYLYFITGIHLDAALQAVHDPTDAHTVYTQMAGVAHMIRYDRSVPPESANLAAELVAPLGAPDTAKAKTDSAHAKTAAPKKNPPKSP
jgi:hypothetical protein